MDAAGSPSARRQRMRAVTILLTSCRFFVSPPSPDFDLRSALAEIKQLLAEERWQEIVRLAEAETARSSDLNYYYGIALARLERWDDAKRAFQEGLKQQPSDKRFPLELAGVSFKQKNYAEAADYLRRALRLDPADTYANDFLASVYFLQGNLDAALKYWNRVSKPQIEEVQFDPDTQGRSSTAGSRFCLRSCYGAAPFRVANHGGKGEWSEHLSQLPIRSRSPPGWEVRRGFSCARAKRMGNQQVAGAAFIVSRPSVSDHPSRVLQYPSSSY